MRILVTGAGGQVGTELMHLAPLYSGWQFDFVDRTRLDMSNDRAIEAHFLVERYDVVIHCAAYTQVDKAESEPALAHAVNAEAVARLARCCAVQNALLIHLSTDYVYSAQNRPFVETDPTDPQSVYAKTKLTGDVAAMSLNPRTIVLRTSWVYAAHGHNFVRTMLRLGRERNTLGVVFDQVGTPTYAADLAAAILAITEQYAQNHWSAGAAQYGVFHYSNEGVTSWYDFAWAIQEMAGSDCVINPIRSSDYPTPATRPAYSVLDKLKIKSTFGFSIPHWRHALKRCMQLLVEESEV
jgi:dTDP-4-dehydrorhamnose reductase